MNIPSQTISGSSAMAEVIRDYPWHDTALGSISEWDLNLIVHTNMILNCPFPMMIWWEKDHIQLYNDACRMLIGQDYEIYPRPLGIPAKECWSDAWHIVKNKLETLQKNPGGLFEEDELIPIYRNNQLENLYWTFSYSNLQDSKGHNKGILIIFKEASPARRELKRKTEEKNFLLSLSDNLRKVSTIRRIEELSCLEIQSYFNMNITGFGIFTKQTGSFNITCITDSGKENDASDRYGKDYFQTAIEDIMIHHELPVSEVQIFEKYHLFVASIAVEEDKQHLMFGILNDCWDSSKKSTLIQVSQRISEIITVAKTQQKLVTSESRYRSLFNNILDAFMVIDFIYDESKRPVNYTFLTTNPAFEVQSGLKNVVGKTILEIMPDVESTWIENYGSVSVTGIPLEFEQYNIGTQRHYEVFASRVEEFPSQVVVVFRDITERKLEVDRKNHFLSVASHELKTPLTSIYASIQLAQKMNKDGKYEQATHILDKAEAYVSRMKSIINGFLHLSQLEGSSVKLRKEVFNYSELIDTCCSELRERYKSHRFSVVCDEALPIEADKNKMILVLQNILMNAVQYSAPKTAVSISCKKTNGKIKISVGDEGIGIPEAELHNIFKKFYRINDNPVSSVSGFGLGLFLSDEILKLHGAQLVVNSTMDKGSVFSFELPLASVP